MRKQIVVHVGYPKTGSSALQAAFALHADKLRRGGIAYPCPDSAAIATGGVCLGNVTKLLFDLGFMTGFDPRTEWPANRITPAFFAQLARVADEQEEDRVLFSGEALFNMSARQLVDLRVCLGTRHDVRIVCFVRDPFEHVYSWWKQVVKALPETRDFAAFVQTATGGGSSSVLRGFPDLHDSGVELMVLNYDAHRRELPQAFLSALGWLSEEERAAITAPVNANPSMTGTQALIASALRRSAPDSLLAEFYMRHAQLNADAGPDRYYDRTQHRLILERDFPTIELINRHLPEGDRLSTVERDAPDVPNTITESDLRILAEAAGHFARLNDENIKSRGLLRRVMNKLRWPRLPIRFNPEMYLFLNPDVADSQSSPQRHYLNNGRKEGRQWHLV